jgi:cysteinyl-tRNA synthetase
VFCNRFAGEGDGMKIYNTLTKRNEEFKTLVEGEVKMYTCGVTVYDVCHIGHARSMCVFEMMRRYLRYRGYRVTFVRNITDIDDKILVKAQSLAAAKKIPIDAAWSIVVHQNIVDYRKDCIDLGLSTPDYEPKASEYVEKIVAFIDDLIAKGYAYVSGGCVYFRTRKYAEESGTYGALSNKKIDDLYAGVRKGEDEAKEESLDFVLWKAKKEGEVGWMSQWGEGRPGWHIECSVMSTDILGEEFDIHGGGLDLVFPHHENEIAQSCAKTGKGYAKYWVHHGLLTIERQKMAKSAGNFITIQAVLEKYTADVLKLFFAQTTYASTVDFSWERMAEAEKAFHKVSTAKTHLERLCNGTRAEVYTGTLAEFKARFDDAMDDDFNSPRGLAVLFDLAAYCNRDVHDAQSAAGAYDLLLRIADVFSFDFTERFKFCAVPESEILAQIEARKQAKAAKDFNRADAIRKELEAKGVILKDAPGGVTEWSLA